jgi:hypothetical protein
MFIVILSNHEMACNSRRWEIGLFNFCAFYLFFNLRIWFLAWWHCPWALPVKEKVETFQVHIRSKRNSANRPPRGCVLQGRF